MTNPFGQTKETREEFLDKLAKFLEGRVEPIKERDNSFRLYFKYYEKQFVFEDMLEAGFSKEVNNAYLKNKTNKTLNLKFKPIEKGGIVHSETLMVSRLNSANFQEKIEIKLPEELKVFKIETDDPIQVKALLENPQVAEILSYYKDSDVKGIHRMSLKIQNGVIFLEFQPSVMRHPSLVSLRTNYQLINDHLEKLSILSEAIDKVAT